MPEVRFPVAVVPWLSTLGSSRRGSAQPRSVQRLGDGGSAERLFPQRSCEMRRELLKPALPVYSPWRGA